jgi:beta-lactamase superfamily II metal-dependent hydrolase
MATLPIPCPPDKSNTTSFCLTIIVMDAGQGDATLIVFPDNTLVLVDCGSLKNKTIVGSEIAKVLTAYLAQANNTLQALVLTHADRDHYNLVKELIIDKGVSVNHVFYSGQASNYDKLGSWLRNHISENTFSKSHFSTTVTPELSYSGAGKAPDVDVRVLSANVGPDTNDDSIVLMVSYLDVNIFLMADATLATESHILKCDKTAKNAFSALLANKATVLKAGHHGSDSSSGTAWIGKIQPVVVFLSSDTKSFSGVSIPRSTVIEDIKTSTSLASFKNVHPDHCYVQYNDQTDRHQQISTDLALCTTLHLLKFAADNVTFTAYGTSWYYTITATESNGVFSRDKVFVTPATDWDNINKAT